MRGLRFLMITVLAVVLCGGAAYGAGRAWQRFGHEPAAAPHATAEPQQQPAGGESPEQPVTPETPAPPAYLLVAGDSGEEVRELQYRLFQVAWLPEVPSGRFDPATVEAVKGFQAKRGLEPTGKVDQRTWDRLEKMTEEPTHDQLMGILHPGPSLLSSGASGDDVRDLQARLKAIEWYFGDVTGTYDTQTVTAVEGFQEKRGIPVTGEVDQRTLDLLHGMTYAPTHEAMHNIVPKPGALDPRCTTGRVLCIDKTGRTLRWVVDGEVQKTVEVRFGSDELPTREGEFSVYRKSRDHVSSLYDTSMPFAMFFSGGQAVHYSPDFAANGYAGASHGCVNVRDYAAVAWLFDQVQIGDKVIVYWS